MANFDFSSLDSLSADTSDELPEWMRFFVDAGGGSDFGNTGYVGEGASIAEGMTPGGLERYGINTTQVEKDAAASVAADKTSASSFKIPKFLQNEEGNFDWLKALLLAGAAYAGSKSKAPPSGGGVAYAYKGPEKQLTRTIAPGPYGPIPQYAAQGGIMQAYAHGGVTKPVAMEDGGFVMTKKAVDGAGGPQGIATLLPGARPIRGPGTGTSDSIPAFIQGRNTVTPARVSNGEAYVPKATVQQAGGSRQLYNLMNMLQRRA